jgi:hypothetical protein
LGMNQRLSRCHALRRDQCTRCRAINSRKPNAKLTGTAINR